MKYAVSTGACAISCKLPIETHRDTEAEVFRWIELAKRKSKGVNVIAARKNP